MRIGAGTTDGRGIAAKLRHRRARAASTAGKATDGMRNGAAKTDLASQDGIPAPPAAASSSNVKTQGIRGGAKSHRAVSAAAAAPLSWATTNRGTSRGAIPAKVSDRLRAMVIAGLAKLVEAVTGVSPDQRQPEDQQ